MKGSSVFWLKFSKGPIDNKPALVQVMAWHLFDAKPLSEPMLNRYNNANMQPHGEMSWTTMRQSSAYKRRYKKPIIGSDTGLSPVWHQPII